MVASPRIHNITDLKQQPNQEAYQQAVRNTLVSLQGAVSASDLTFYSNRPIEEVEALQKEVSSILPAGNIAGMVTSGLANLRNRKWPKSQAYSDVSALLRSLEVPIFQAVFYPTATILLGYQKLLTLTGTSEENAFPEGLWQFYLEFAMREDTARHSNETIGFQSTLQEHGIRLSPIDKISAWLCAVSQIYFQYDDLLYNEWREQVYLNLLDQILTEANLEQRVRFLAQAWMAQRPYEPGSDASSDENYPAYRRRRFDKFIQDFCLKLLPAETQAKLAAAYAQQEERYLAAYQRQMTILATLIPERYREVRQPLPIWQAKIGLILNDRYYLIPACVADTLGQPILFQQHQAVAALPFDEQGHLYDPYGQLVEVARTGSVYNAAHQLIGHLRPAHYQTIRQEVATIFKEQATTPPSQFNQTSFSLDQQLTALKRSEQANQRPHLSEFAQYETKLLQQAPVLINWDEQEVDKPLAYIRQGRRGIGDHALTIFRTSKSMVFDQSHIFFDGVWGLAIAEVLTREAISWGVLFSRLTPPSATEQPPIALQFQPEKQLSQTAIRREVSAESIAIDLVNLHNLRNLLPRQHFKVKLTINDLLILYRSKFGMEYQLDPKIQTVLDSLKVSHGEVYELVKASMQKLHEKNPSVLIPLNAATVNPRDRLYPTTFRNPFTDMWDIYEDTLEALATYRQKPTDSQWQHFANLRGSLLTQMSYFGDLLRAYKRVALQGGSTSNTIMKLLAYVPMSVREMLNELPQRIDVLNEVLKGEEVISNVGRVAKKSANEPTGRGSSITRFISAKDDNENKTLVWGAVTDDQEIFHLSLRDFRPHVAALATINKLAVAQMMAEDQVTAFATGFNQLVTQISDIIQAKVIA